MEFKENWEEWDSSKEPFHVHVIAGICAGVTEHCLMFPFDTMKTVIQADRRKRVRVRPQRILQKLVQNRGMHSLWSGVSTIALGCVPAHALYFSIFERVKAMSIVFQMPNFFHADIPAAASISGICASMAHDLVITPMDCIKQRLQLGKYEGKLGIAFLSIVRREGFHALYRSYPTTVIISAPFAALMMPFNEYFKHVFNPTGKVVSAKSISFGFQNMLVFFLSGGFSAMIAGSVTCPLDVVKTRLQTQNIQTITRHNGKKTLLPIQNRFGIHFIASKDLPLVPDPHMKYYGLVDSVIKIYKYEGLRAFTKGLLPRIVYLFPGAGISWCTYETIKRLMLKT